MKLHEIVNLLMFDYQNLSEEEIANLCNKLPLKIIRWLGMHHPDNKTRKIFFKLTGVEIGEGTVININFVVLDDYMGLLKIGKRVAISPNVTVICSSNPNNSNLSKIAYVSKKLICKKPIIIEDDVWIGANVVILPGSVIGRSSIIGAGSIIKEDVPSYSIVAGIPAKVIRYLRGV